MLPRFLTKTIVLINNKYLKLSENFCSNLHVTREHAARWAHRGFTAKLRWPFMLIYSTHDKMNRVQSSVSPDVTLRLRQEASLNYISVFYPLLHTELCLLSVDVFSALWFSWFRMNDWKLPPKTQWKINVLRYRSVTNSKWAVNDMTGNQKSLCGLGFIICSSVNKRLMQFLSLLKTQFTVQCWNWKVLQKTDVISLLGLFSVAFFFIWINKSFCICCI